MHSPSIATEIKISPSSYIKKYSSEDVSKQLLPKILVPRTLPQMMCIESMYQCEVAVNFLRTC